MSIRRSNFCSKDDKVNSAPLVTTTHNHRSTDTLDCRYPKLSFRQVTSMSQVQPDIEAQASASAQSEWTLIRRLKESSHPVAILFYVALRLSPLAVYVFGSWFVGNSVLLFIIVALLVASDFWNVKNISGRLMVGLRWWNETAEDGSSTWVFETANPERYINPIDSKTFWILLYAVPAAWVLFAFLAILKFSLMWLLVVVLSLVLSLTNTFAFSRCDKFARANMIIGQVSSSVFSGLFSKLGSRIFK